MRYGLCRALVLAAVTMFSASSYAGHYGTKNLFQSVSGHYSGYDLYEKMYAAGTFGDIYEITRGFAYYLTTPPGDLRAIASYYDNAYGDDHVIAATSVGIEEIWYKPGHGVHTDWITTAPLFTSVGAFYSPSDNNQHVVAAYGDALFEFWWGPTTGGIQSRDLISLPDYVLTVSAYFTPVDNVMHAVVLLQNKTLYEVWWYTSSSSSYVYSSYLLPAEGATGASGFGPTTGSAANHEDFLVNDNKHVLGRPSFVWDIEWDCGFRGCYQDTWVSAEYYADFVAVAGWYIPGVEKAAVMADAQGYVSWNVGNASGWRNGADTVAYCNEAGGCSYTGLNSFRNSSKAPRGVPLSLRRNFSTRRK
jgi:hypothetical protein